MTGGAAALCLTGLLTLTTPLWAAPTHIIDGINTANELLVPMMIIGSLLFMSGLSLLQSARRAALAFNQSR
jgi:hypothetical protein